MHATGQYQKHVLCMDTGCYSVLNTVEAALVICVHLIEFTTFILRITLIMLSFFTTVKMKYLTTFTTVFLLSLLLRCIVWLPSLRCFISLLSKTRSLRFTTDYAHYTVLLSLLLKWNLWLRSLHCLTLLLLTLEIALPSLRCSYLLSTK